MGDDYGPSLGRGLGVGSTDDQTVTNAPLSPQTSTPEMQGMRHSMPGMTGAQRGEMPMKGEIAANANRVPGFPQDAYMESPMMAIDDMVKKPQNYALRPGWSGFMQGMMTFLRVLPPDQYEEIIEQIRRGQPQNMPVMRHPM